MNLNNFFYKIAHIFEIKKHTEQEYQIKNEDLNFFNIPMSVILVVNKYGWVVFYHKLINYGKLIFHKYHAKLNRLYVETRNSFKGEGALRVFKRTWNYIFYGKGVLNKNEFIKRKRYLINTINQEIDENNPPVFFPFRSVYYVSNIANGGARKYITDLIDVFETPYLRFVQIKNLKDLNRYKNSFKKDDILLFQYLFFSDLTFEDIIDAKEKYGIKLIIPVHDFYFLQKLPADFYQCHNGVYSNYKNKSLNPSVLKLLKTAYLIIYPSNFVKNIFDAIFVFKNAKLSRHIDYKICDFLNIPKVEKTINIGIINNITVYKGADYYSKLFSIKQYNGHTIQYHIFGANDIKSDNIIFHGAYDEGDIFELLRKNNIHGLVFLNKWGETYSYSLTKGIVSGLPILYSNLGAYMERLGNNRKFFPIHDIHNIKPDMHVMLDMILENQEASVSNKVVPIEKDVPDLYRELFSRNNKDANLENKKFTVSVVIPNYNYKDFLAERLDSIVGQTYKPLEIIFLDDCSKDNSVVFAKNFLSKIDIPYKIIENNSNAGCFKQWAKGVREAKGDLIWIAEADDSCELNFLETLVPKFNDSEVGLAYAQSLKINSDGKKEESYLAYLEGISGHNNRWRNDYVNTGINEIRNYLVIKNTIVNASAVVMRRDLIANLGEKIGGGFKQAGDWYTYIQILRNSKIAFSASPLNHHRYHQKNIVSRSGANSEEKSKQLVSESLDIQNLILLDFCISKRLATLALSHTKLVCRNNLNKEIDFFPEYDERVKNFGVTNNSLQKKILFFSTNDGWGGSEISCAKIAQAFSEDDYSVALCMKKHEPRPEIIKKIISDNNIAILERIKMADYCKSENVASFIKNFSPDLIFISQGHVFEGRELMKWCQFNGFDYVNFIPLVTEQHLQIINPDEKSIMESGRLLQLSKVIFSDNYPAKKVMGKLFDGSFDNFSLMRNAFDVPYDQNYNWSNNQEGVYKLMYIGRLYYLHKGLDMLLEVLAMKKWKDRPLQIMAYGKGNDRDLMEKYIRENSIKNFFFCGYTEDLAAEIIKYQGIIFPSRMEGMPIALVDALLCHRMGIVTPEGGMVEFIKDGETGFVAAETTTKGLDECMEKAWQRRNEWESIGKYAGKKVRELVPKFPQKQIIDTINTILD